MNLAPYYASLCLIAAIPGLCFTLDDGILGSINRVIGVACFAVWGIFVVSTGRMRRLTWFHVFTAAYTVWYAISLWWSVDPRLTEFRMTLLQSLALVVMLWDIYRTREKFEAGLQALVLGAWASVAGTVVAFVQGNSAKQWEKRFSGSGYDPNDLALLAGIVIPVAVYLAINKQNSHPLVRLSNYLYPFGAVAVIILTGSRGGLMAAVPAFLLCAARFRIVPAKWKAVLAAVIAGAAFMVSHVDIGQQTARLSTAVDSMTNDHLTGRADVWRGGWTAYQKHPLLGVGGGAFPTAAFAYSGEYEEPKLVAHNTYLSVLVELGPIGVILFGMIIIVIFAALARLPSMERNTWITAMLVWMVGVSALSWDFRSQTWLIFILVYCGANLGRSDTVPAKRNAPAATTGSSQVVPRRTGSMLEQEATP
ncbi:MAG: O-antigen ligase family protein [Capsulimonadaceae bacterium]